MPRFDFQCEKCQHIFEGAIPFGSKRFPKCPLCHGSVHKQIAPPLGIHFKGSGFYKTDSSQSSVTAEPSESAKKVAEKKDASETKETPKKQEGDKKSDADKPSQKH